jgi:hypothetical protein
MPKDKGHANLLRWLHTQIERRRLEATCVSFPEQLKPAVGVSLDALERFARRCRSEPEILAKQPALRHLRKGRPRSARANEARERLAGLLADAERELGAACGAAPGKLAAARRVVLNDYSEHEEYWPRERWPEGDHTPGELRDDYFNRAAQRVLVEVKRL